MHPGVCWYGVARPRAAITSLKQRPRTAMTFPAPHAGAHQCAMFDEGRLLGRGACIRPAWDPSALSARQSRNSDGSRGCEHEGISACTEAQVKVPFGLQVGRWCTLFQDPRHLQSPSLHASRPRRERMRPRWIQKGREQSKINP